MPDNFEPNFSFGIEDTLEMGDQKLVNDLLSPESSTEDPENVTPITPEKEEEKKPVQKKPAPAKEKAEDDKSRGNDNNFLEKYLKGGDEEEGDDENPGDDEGNPGDDEEPGDDQEEDQGPFGAIAKGLFKAGVFTTEEGEEETEIKTADEFLERFQAEKKKGAMQTLQNFLSQFGEDYQQAFTAIYVNGVNPREYFTTYNKIENFAGMDLTKENNQEAVVTQMLLDQGYEQDDIEQEIERLKNYGDLETTATRHHKILVKKEALKLQKLEEDSKAELQAKADAKAQYIQNVRTVLQDKLKTKEFDGIPVNPKLANELQDFLLVDKWKTASGELLTDFDLKILELKRPENHATKVKVALLLKIMEKDPTLSTIQKTGISKKSSQVFEEVVKQSTKAKTGNPSQKKPGSWFI